MYASACEVVKLSGAEHNVAELRCCLLAGCVSRFGMCELLRSFDGEGAGRVQDSSPIKPLQPPKAVTVEDSFKSCSSPAAAAHVMKVLAPDFLARLLEEYEVSSYCWSARFF